VEGRKITAVARHILDWLEGLVVRPVLLYRRLRYGYTFRRIPMSGPKYAKVDPADYKRLRKYKFIARKARNSFYAQMLEPNLITSKKMLHMHQIILEVPKGMVVDHINNDGMDNRSANLRAATKAQNSRNRKKLSRPCSSKYKGVWWHKNSRKWQAEVVFEKKKIHLGTFKNEIDAAKAYDEAAKKYHGEFACLNFPE
jgi:hypothetical protein